MVNPPPVPNPIHFGVFEVDLRTGELRKNGIKLKLSGQPFQVLTVLLSRPGEVVTREELQKHLWPDTFVDTERNLNTAINKIREVLGDSAENPRFVETVPRRGYRFIAPVNGISTSSVLVRSAVEGTKPHRHIRSAIVYAAGGLRTVGSRILVGMACLLVVLVVYLKFRPRVEPRTLMAMPFAAYAGVAGCPAFSPDGSQIVFAWNGDPESQLPRSPDLLLSGSQSEDLYVKVIGHENLIRLTHHPSEWICPTWSPDGTRIAFHRMSRADTGVYMVPALGGPERKLRSTAISHWFEVVPISWSPDGKWIAYVDSLPGDERRLFLLSVETLERRQIPHAAECVADWLPAFSHNGQQLAYFCLQNPYNFKNGLYTVATSGGAPKLLTTVDGWWGPGAPTWSADDEKLIFANPQYGTVGTGSRLYEITLADGSIRKLPLAQNAYEPAISKNGDKLAYTTTLSDGHMEIWRKDLLNPQAAGVELIPSTHAQQKQQYSPNGKMIAFESERSGVREVWVSDADGRNLVQISDFKDPRTGFPSWSPDSQKIVFYTHQSGRGEAYVADISEQMPRKLVTNIPDISFPSWSHDGKWIYFLSNSAKPGIYRCPVDGGDALLLLALPPGDLGMNPMESFDGETIYFTSVAFNSMLEKVSIKRPGAQSLVKEMPRVLNLEAWTVVQGGIYFVPAEAPKSVRYLDFNTKEIRQILAMDKDFGYGLSVSQDGHWILYSQTDEVNSIIMLVDHFR